MKHTWYTLAAVALILTALFLYPNYKPKEAHSTTEYNPKSIVDICRKYNSWITIEMEPARTGTMVVRCQVPRHAKELDYWGD